MNKRQLVHYVLNSVLTQLVAFVAVIYLAKILSVEEFGKLALVQFFGLLTAQIAHLGFSIPLERSFFVCEDDYRKILSFTLILTSITTLVIGLAVYLSSPLINQFLSLNYENGRVYFLTHLSESLGMTFLYFQSFYRNSANSKRYLSLSMSNVVITYGLTYVLLFTTNIGLLSLIAGQLVTRLLLVTLSILDMKNLLTFKIDGLKLRESLRLSLPVLPLTFLKVANSNFDKFIVSNFFNPAQVGRLTMAQKVTEAGHTLNTAIDNTFMPTAFKLMYQNNQEGLIKMGQLLTKFFFLSVAVAFGVSLFSEEIINLFAGTKYEGSSKLVLLLFPHYLFVIFGKQNQIQYSQKTYLITVFFLIRLIINVTLTYFLVKSYGITGAAIATSSVSVVMFLITQPVHQRLVPIKWELRKIALTMAFTIGCCAGLYYASSTVSAPGLMFSLKVLAYVLFIFLGYKLNIFSNLLNHASLGK